MEKREYLEHQAPLGVVMAWEKKNLFPFDSLYILDLELKRLRILSKVKLCVYLIMSNSLFVGCSWASFFLLLGLSTAYLDRTSQVVNGYVVKAVMASVIGVLLHLLDRRFLFTENRYLEVERRIIYIRESWDNFLSSVECLVCDRTRGEVMYMTSEQIREVLVRKAQYVLECEWVVKKDRLSDAVSDETVVSCINSLYEARDAFNKLFKAVSSFGEFFPHTKESIFKQAKKSLKARSR